MTCQWYLLCDNAPDGFVWHPVLAWVPTCKRCADKHSMVLVSENRIMESLRYLAAWPERTTTDVWGNAVDLLGGATGDILPATAQEILKIAIGNE